MEGRRQAVMVEAERPFDPPTPSIPRSELPPGPPEWPLIGQALRLRSDLISLLEEAATYGDVSTVSVRPILIYLVNHPDLNREVLVGSHQKVGRGNVAFEPMRWMLGSGLTVSTGAFHLRQRRLIQPHFHRRFIESYADAMTSISRDKSTQWRDGQEVDMEQEMRHLTLHIVAKALFDIEAGDVVQRVGESFAEANRYMYLRVTQPVPMRRLFHRLPLPATRRFEAARAYLDEFMYDSIRERRSSGADGDDLLCMLLQARYEDAEGEEDGGMSDEMVRDELASMYIAGHDSTAMALTYAFYLLSQNPEVQEQLSAELDAVLGERDAATLSDLPNLHLTDQIITETLRLYPPLWGLGRMVFEPIDLGGYHVPPGVTVMISPFVTHRDPRWFDGPLEFRPERWTDDFRSELPRFAYFPFGGGPHQCIGQGFALMEANIALATLCKRWTAVARSRAEPVPQITLNVRGGMPMTLTRRR